LQESAPEDPKKKTKLKPLLIGGAVIGVAEILRRLFLRLQLFVPERRPIRSWNPADYGIPEERVSELWIDTDDGEILYAWYVCAAEPIASILFCHGNTGNVTFAADIIPHLVDANLNVLLFDYRGFGRSTGSAYPDGVVSDALAAARFHDSIRPASLPSILYGYSLGGAIAAQVAGAHPFDALILQSTFTNVADMAKMMFPALPLHVLAGKTFDTRAAMRSLRLPLLIIHGNDDEVCPIWMGRLLYDDAPAPKRFVSVEDGLHKDLFIRDADGLIFSIEDFVRSVPIRPQTETRAAHSSVSDSIKRRWRRFRRDRGSRR
jgi:fermentation-respiration switch protein FrsA (DUF1100 family)